MSKLTILSPAVLAVFLLGSASAQDRDRDRMRDADDWDAGNNRYTRLVRGTTIPVRPTEAIDVERKDNRVYMAVVDQDVMGSNGRLAIPRGSTVEMMVRVAPDNDLILDLESVNVRGGQRYAISTAAARVDSQNPGMVGAIVGAIQGGEVRGRTVRIPRNTLITFRVDRPLEMGVADRGVDREGHHYHDWYDRDQNRDRDH
jgi:hypothetical protein